MKKSLALLLIFALTLALAACGGAAIPESAGTAETPDPTESAPLSSAEGSAPAKTSIKISHPFLRSRLDALPVATPEMSEDELRDICVKYMQMQREVVWTPDSNFTYEAAYAGAADAGGNITLYAGRRYQGMPYTYAHYDLECFLDLYNEETGLVEVSKYGNSAGLMMGNYCSTAAYYAWARVSTTLRWVGSHHICPAYGYLPIGPYKCDLTQTEHTEATSTGVICEANGQQTMFESYACLKPASGIICHTGINGHLRMIRDAATVVRNADGTIDGAKSCVVCVEQVSLQREYTGEDGKVYEIGRLESRYTFDQLWKDRYLPFDVPELCGKAKVEEAWVRIESENDGAHPDLDAILKGKVVSNYPISRVDVSFTKADGSVAYEGFSFGTCKNYKSREVNFSRIFTSGTLTRYLKKGETYRFTVTARLCNGETKTVFEKDLTR